MDKNPGAQRMRGERNLSKPFHTSTLIGLVQWSQNNEEVAEFRGTLNPRDYNELNSNT